CGNHCPDVIATYQIEVFSIQYSVFSEETDYPTLKTEHWSEKMPKNIVLIGTLDTKGPEIKYLRDQLQSLGLQTTVIDSGILGEPLDIVPDISRETAASYANT